MRSRGSAGIEVPAEVREFLRELSRRVEVTAAYLFGSRARGEALDVSDVDLIVVSPDFDGVPVDERLRLVYGIWPDEVPADIIPLGASEFERLRGKSVLLRDASRYWIRLTPDRPP